MPTLGGKRFGMFPSLTFCTIFFKVNTVYSSESIGNLMVVDSSKAKSVLEILDSKDHIFTGNLGKTSGLQ